MPQQKINVYLIGDSTMSIKEPGALPETGWGMPFAHFFDSSVVVHNHAKNGRSTKSFRAEGLWTPIQSKLRAGDYVIIQFGHNDEGKEKIGRYTTPQEFGANLKRYVEETRSREATPILLTPVARRRFDPAGNVLESHPEYSDVVRKVAKENNVTLIDLDQRSQALLKEFGPENSKLLFLHLKPGEHPNFPSGKTDDTHFSELGARKVAQIVLAGIRQLNNELAKRIVKPR